MTRWFSWGPYTRLDEPRAYIERLAGERERGERLDLLVVHREHGPAGITGLSEFSARDRRCVVGTWFGRRFWGTGANRESKAMVAHLAFVVLGLHRVGSYSNPDNVRSTRALLGVGFRHEGVLRDWHRHGGRHHDVNVFGLLRARVGGRAARRGAGPGRGRRAARRSRAAAPGTAVRLPPPRGRPVPSAPVPDFLDLPNRPVQAARERHHPRDRPRADRPGGRGADGERRAVRRPRPARLGLGVRVARAAPQARHLPRPRRPDDARRHADRARVAAGQGRRAAGLAGRARHRPRRGLERRRPDAAGREGAADRDAGAGPDGLRRGRREGPARADGAVPLGRADPRGARGRRDAGRVRGPRGRARPACSGPTARSAPA